MVVEDSNSYYYCYCCYDIGGEGDIVDGMEEEQIQMMALCDVVAVVADDGTGIAVVDGDRSVQQDDDD